MLLVTGYMLACGHTLCSGCLENITECPLCKCARTIAGPNMALRSLALGLKATCQFGCVTGNVEVILKHLMADCLRVTVVCTHAGCGALVPRKELKDHRDSCEWAIVRCPCGGEMERLDISEHLSTVCPKGNIKCHMGCGATIRRCEAFGHQATCPDAVVPCTVRGCPEIVRRRELADHMAKSMERHARVASNLAMCLQRQLVTDKWAGEMKPMAVAVKGLEITSFAWFLHPFKAELLKGREKFCSPVFRALQGGWRMVLEKTPEGVWLLSLLLTTRVESALVRFKFVLPTCSHERDTEHFYFPHGGVVFREGQARGGNVKMSQADLETYTTSRGMGGEVCQDCLLIHLYIQEVDTVQI
ncbi:TNF receptor-associated factor 3-like [Branchiostoma floridae x Branchiostoma japonicum]